MKNANIFVDVYSTLVEANGKLLAGARDGLAKLKSKGCHLFLWSSVGVDYAKKIAGLHIWRIYLKVTLQNQTSSLMICPKQRLHLLFLMFKRKHLGQ